MKVGISSASSRINFPVSLETQDLASLYKVSQSLVPGNSAHQFLISQYQISVTPRDYPLDHHSIVCARGRTLSETNFILCHTKV